MDLLIAHTTRSLSASESSMKTGPDLGKSSRMYSFPLGQLHAIIGLGWVVMSTWIEDESMSMTIGTILTNISFKVGKGAVRIVLTTDVRLGTASRRRRPRGDDRDHQRH